MSSSVMTGKAIGVDGCRSGWIAAVANSSFDIEWGLFPSLETLWRTHGPECDLLLIDMPIGLVEAGPDGRECDRHARRMLSPHRHSSIFTPPCRPALYAPEGEASKVNFKHTGKKLSRQSINIMPKMREVDQWVRQLPPEAQKNIHESHPEVVFTALNAGSPPVHNKKKPEGREERLQLLESCLPASRSFLDEAMTRFPRKLVLADDLVDALALAVVARQIAQDGRKLQRLPASVSTDGAGLLMEIVYVNP